MTPNAEIIGIALSVECEHCNEKSPYYLFSTRCDGAFLTPTRYSSPRRNVVVEMISIASRSEAMISNLYKDFECTKCKRSFTSLIVSNYIQSGNVVIPLEDL